MIRERKTRAPSQNGRYLLPFIKFLSVPRGGNCRFRPEDTRVLAPVSQWKSEQEQTNTGTELFGPPARARPVTPTRRGWVPDPRTASRPLSNCSPEAQAIQPAVRWFPAPQHPSPAKPPPSSGLKASARWSSTSGDRSGGQTESRARLRDETRYPRLSRRAVSSHSRSERAGRERRRGGGRGREGSESWPDLPFTQCLEAREGRKADCSGPFLSSWEKNTGTCRERPVSHPLAAHQDTPAPATQPGPLLTLPQIRGAGLGRGFSKLQWNMETRNGDLRWVPTSPWGRVPEPRSACDPRVWDAERA